MRSDHHRRRSYLGGLASDGDPFRFERGKNGRVVHQIAEDGQRPRFDLLECQGDGVADAEAHAERFRADDVHAGI